MHVKDITFIFILITNIIISYSNDLCVKPLQLNDTETVIIAPSINTDYDKIYALSKIWSEIKYNFVNIDKIEFNIDSLYKTTIPTILKTQNDIEFYDELQYFIASFQDGHTELIKRSYSWNDVNDYIPCNLIDIEGKIYFSKIRKSAGIDSLLLGAEIIEIEGVSVLDYIQKHIYPFISASTNQSKFFQAINRIQVGRKGSYFNGKARKNDGQLIPFSILRNGESTRSNDDEQWEWFNNKKTQNRRTSEVSLEWRNEIAVLDIRSFRSDKVIADIDSLSLHIKERAKGLIIDLRNNRGGSTHIAIHLQKYLTDNKLLLTFGAQTRINDGYGKSQGNYRKEYSDFYLNKAYKTIEPDTVWNNNIVPFKCPVVILVGRYTFSAAEDFLVNIYETPKRPLIIGEPTGGSTGAPLIISLPNGAMARICSLRVLFPYSLSPFIGKGITPDIIVEQSLSDYLKDNDAALEQAINILNTNKHQNSN